jgi:hypothetical protein
MCDEIMAFLFENPEARVQQSGYFKVIPFAYAAAAAATSHVFFQLFRLKESTTNPTFVAQSLMS